MAIDEIAEAVVAELLRRRGRHRVLLRGPRLRGVSASRARSSSSTRSTAPARRGRARVLLRVDRGACRRRLDATLGDVSFGVVHEIKSGDRFFATRGAGARAERADGRADRRSRCRRDIDLARAVLDRRVCAAGRCCRCRSLLEDADRRLVDARRLLRSRLGHVQHDAHRDRPARRVRRHRAAPRRRAPELEAALPARSARARSARTSRTTSRRRRSIVQEAGGVVTAADGEIARRPARRSAPATGCGVAVLASASPAAARPLLQSRSTSGMDRAVPGSRRADVTRLSARCGSAVRCDSYNGGVRRLGRVPGDRCNRSSS